MNNEGTEDTNGEALELEVETPEFEDEQQDADDGVLIAFADDETEEETPKMKYLREQIRERDRKIARLRRSPTTTNDDPEPQVPDRPRSVADFDYDEDRFNAALDTHIAAKEEHLAWKARQSERENSRAQAANEQAVRVEKQKNALGVADYDTRAASVKETLTDAQLAILINGADNPAQLIYALGRSESRLSLLAGEENLARFAVMIGKMEKEIKVIRKSAPAPEPMVRGATAPLAQGGDKHLAKLEREAEKTGDRSALAAYRRELRKRQDAA